MPKIKEGNFKSSKWIIWFILAIVVFIFFITFAIGPLFNFVFGPIGVRINYSTGERSGQMIKLSEKGLIWKTWEGTLGLTQSGAYIDYWDFSVDNQDPNKDAIVNQLTEILNSGELVNLKYEQKLVSPPWRSGTTYFIKEINWIKDKAYEN